MEGRKRCPDCEEEKDVSEFGLNKRMADGLARYCKTCFRRRSIQSYRKRKEEQGKAVREAVAVPDGHKYCPRCKEVKPVADFGGNRSTRSGLTAYCKPCHTIVTRENKIKKYGSERNYLLQYRYGITEDDFERMLARQGGLCAVCQSVPGTFVDHCHRSGAVRGILCFNCNNGLGHFGDNLVLLELAALYLDGEVLWPEFVVLPERRDGGVVPPTRDYHLAQRYQVRHEDVERMISAQHGLCVVCWDRPPSMWIIVIGPVMCGMRCACRAIAGSGSSGMMPGWCGGRSPMWRRVRGTRGGSGRRGGGVRCRAGGVGAGGGGAPVGVLWAGDAGGLASCAGEGLSGGCGGRAVCARVTGPERQRVVGGMV